MDAGTAAGADNNNVTLSGGSVYHFGFKSANAGFEFRIDGTVFKDANGTKTQLSSTTDWIDPHGDASSNYFIRYHSISQSSFDATLKAGSITSASGWNDLGTQRDIKYRLLDPELYGIDDFIIFTVEIRYLDGTNISYNNQTSSLDSANIMDAGTYDIDLIA